MKTFFNLILCLAFSATVVAQYGTLDKSFAEQGIMTDDRLYGFISLDMIRQLDGKIIFGGGSFMLARYNATGITDSSFGNNGVTDYITNTNCRAICLQQDGKIIAAGDTALRGNTYGSAIFIVRYNTDGSIDRSFGDNGRSPLVRLEKYNNPEKVLIRTDGKIIVSGKARNDPSGEPDRIFAICYNPDGSVDESFGENGVFSHYNQYGLYEVKGLVVDEQNNVYIGFSISGSSLKYNFIKLDINGSTVADYGEGGLATHIFSEFSGSQMNDMVLLADGKILTVGTSGEVLLCRFTANGHLDETFGTGGYTLLNLPDNNSEGNSLVVNDNKIIVAGRVNDLYPSFNHVAGLFGFNINGSIDSSFALNGVQKTDEAGNYSYFQDITFSSEGQIIASGNAFSSLVGNSVALIAQYNGQDDYIKNPKYVKIKKWLHRHGFTWEDFPGKNISYYAVQRSGNGNNFTEIARLFNRNNQQQFNYVDAMPLTGDNYYRLAAVSADGAVAYSNVLAIPNNTATVKVYPNPAKNNLQVEGLPATEKTKLVITDLNGVARMSAAANSNSYNWNISGLKAGNYILLITNGSNVVTKKFLKE